MGEKRVRTKEQFIEKANRLHENKYDYDLVEYINSTTKVRIVCRKHGEFSLVANQHIHIKQKTGCPTCADENKSKLLKCTLDEVLEKFKEIHDNDYDYSAVEYKGMHTKVQIKCNRCGVIFLQTPNSHINQQSGCNNCNTKEKMIPHRKTNEKFISQAKERWDESYGYSYENTQYISKQIRIKFNCKKHGEVEQYPARHLKCGCPFCNGRGVSKHSDITFRILANAVHNNEYDYSLVSYKGMHENVYIICKKHGVFLQKPANHIHNQNKCPSCNNIKSVSRAEKSLLEFIRQNYQGEITENDRKILDGKEIDIYLPELKIGFEYHGMYYHTETSYGKKKHWQKANIADKKQIKLIQIYEWEWEIKQEIVKSKILSELGKNKVVFARKTKVVDLSIGAKNEFLNNNHLQGKDGTIICYGLFYNNEIVSCMTFGPSRFNDKYDYELTRFCSAKGINVIGGASKLLSHFRKEYSGSIISYADRRWSKGNIYNTLGFKLDGITKPSFSYYHINKKHLYNRMKFQKKKLKKIQGYDKNLTEYEIMQLNGYDRIWDAGQLRFVLE